MGPAQAGSADSPPPALAYVPAVYPQRPRRSRVNGVLWSVAIIGAVFLAGALPLESAEEFAAAYEPHRDAKGSYVASAQDLTRAFGAEVIWAESGSADPTTKCVTGGENPDSVLAWSCGAEPYLIRINRIAYDMPGVIYTPVFVDAVKHELAHLVIQQRCGRSRPNAGTVELEGVTQSYAVLYLGADRKALGDLSSTFPQYALSTRTDEAATWIHEGVCWFESSEMTR